MTNPIDEKIWRELERRSQSDTGDAEEDAYNIGVADGFSQAVQSIDRLTGGDGEYRYNTLHDPERHCPDPDVMIARIVARSTRAETPQSIPSEREASTLCAIAEALLAVVDAVRDYLPPDGITEAALISRVIAATDNPEINPFIHALESAINSQEKA